MIARADRASGLKDQIADRRKVYNTAVDNNTIRIERLPDVLIATVINALAFDPLDFDESAKKNQAIYQSFSDRGPLRANSGIKKK